MGSWTDGSLDDDLLLLPILPWLIPYSPLFRTSQGCYPLVLFIVHAQSSCTVCAQNTIACCTVCAQVMANSSQQGVLVLIPSRPSASSTALPCSLICLLVLTFLDSGEVLLSMSEKCQYDDQKHYSILHLGLYI